ncbi:D-ribose pyranase [Alicyclobacillus macrosporangiidus]|jgi:D-ribose pyranase|uniref:D-ribose pyranase n=1 Tax=Alicyclobacillus macrosporangiidus TaxID=392015 RepID=A0A1I7JHZ6_9BACL|nr:D-ribose pyranase [Alicyclobacillus macrosporangiidus]SFU84805.1 D-ribose pyranase [Alicyclobacillus macrosporangiidus]
MKKSGILNPALMHLLTSMGHTDYITVCDQGFPVPQEQTRVDLALVSGIPTVLDVLCAIAGEFIIDRVVITQEMREVSPGRVREIEALLPGILLETVSHLELKSLSRSGKGVVRTADTCPYANILVVSG